MNRILAVIALVITIVAPAAPADAGARAGRSLVLQLELAELPGAGAPRSVWEMSYSWRVASLDDFIRWQMSGSDPAAKEALGLPLSRQSIRRDVLSAPASRRLEVRVPASPAVSTLLGSGKPYVAFLTGTVRVYDAALGREFLERVSAHWMPGMLDGDRAPLTMAITASGEFEWWATAERPRPGSSEYAVPRSR